MSVLKPGIRPKQRSRMAIPYVIAISVLAMAAGIGAFGLIVDNLEQVAWDRVTRGEIATHELLNSEKARIENLAISISENPALIELLKDADAEGLSKYINDLQIRGEADFVTIHDAAGQILIGSSPSLLCSHLQRQSQADYCIFPGTVPQLALLAGQSVNDESTGKLLGYVTVGITFDNELERKLAASTGLAQSILVDDQRVATSLETDSTVIDDEAYKQVIDYGQPTTTAIMLDGHSYYELLFPIRDTAKRIVAVAEIDFPASNLVAIQGWTLLAFIALSMVVAGTGFLAGYLARQRMAAPLKDVSNSSVSAEQVQPAQSAYREAASTDEKAIKLQDNSEEETTKHLHSYFLANVRHEFRTPLCALNASVEFLLDEFDQLTKNEIGELLKSIHLSVLGLQTLIDNLMESTNIEAGRFIIRPTSIELNDVVVKAVRITQPLISRRHQSVTIEQAPQLPKVRGDPIRLTQVLVNLLSNASKFGPMGQNIIVRSEPAGDGQVRVNVVDQGPGIPSAEQDKLFHRFAHPGSSDDALYGLGLGLSVVKAIVEEHGGKVGVDERPGGGSIFWFTIPLAADAI